MTIQLRLRTRWACCSTPALGLATLLLMPVGCNRQEQDAASGTGSGNPQSSQEAPPRPADTVARQPLKIAVQQSTGAAPQIIEVPPLYPSDVRDALVFVEPKRGAIFAPGEELKVAIDAANEFAPQNGILISFGDDARSVAGPPYTATFTVSDKRTGPAQISAIGIDANRKAVTAVQDIVIRSSSPLAGITFSRAELFIFMSLASHKDYLRVDALYEDGRQIPCDSSMEVTYRIADTSVASVDAQGFVTAHAVGKTTLHASLGSFTTSAKLQVFQD